jgi:hypothetical protein
MRPSVIDELLTYLFDGRSHPLSTPMESWLTSSRRFIAFANTFRDKIRKKLRTTRDPETLLDLQLELETAYLLLRERSLSLVYEPQHCGQGRCPDFAVTFTTSLTFMVEVTRLRASPKRSPVVSPLENTSTAMPEFEPLADAVSSKLGQLLSQSSNVLIIGIDTLSLTQSDLQATMLRIQQRAEGNDSTFWQRYGFRERADFFRHYYRLSEVLVRGSQWGIDDSLVAWINPQAKHPLPGKVRTAVYRSHMSKA